MRFEGRQQAARVGGKGHAKGNGCDGCVWRYGAGK
jgi:hypothetical protein